MKIQGLDQLQKQLKSAPRALETAVENALALGIAMVETESKRRSPLDTGTLRSSIGGVRGYSFVKGLKAGVGTNLDYAIYVHENLRARHPIGEAKFMDKGAKASMPFIKKQMEKVGERVAFHITK